MSTLPWFIKHRPKKFTEVEISDDSSFKVLNWLKTNKNGGVLAITGGTGVGKTSLVYTIAKALKFRVFEYSDISNDRVKSFGKTIDGLLPLILIDESDFPIFFNIPKFPNIPVIYTSTVNIQDHVCIRITKPDNLLVLKAIKKVLSKENKYIDDRIILQLSKICNSDLRSVLNYCQLISHSSEIKDFKVFERLASHSISYACRTVLSKRLCFNELESLFSEKVLSLCLNNLISKSHDTNALKSFECVSEMSMYPEKYKFMSLDSINKVRIEFEYNKETVIDHSFKKAHNSAIHFLPFYKRNLQNKQSVKHLQCIFQKYKISNLTGIDKEIEEYIDMNIVDNKIFKYKFNSWSSSAVKRDISIDEILNL